MLVKPLSAIIRKNIGGSLEWDGTPDAHWEMGRKLGGGDFKIGRWDWDYENRHWADTDSNVLVQYCILRKGLLRGDEYYKIRLKRLN